VTIFREIREYWVEWSGLNGDKSISGEDFVFAYSTDEVGALINQEAKLKAGFFPGEYSGSDFYVSINRIIPKAQREKELKAVDPFEVITDLVKARADFLL